MKRLFIGEGEFFHPGREIRGAEDERYPRRYASETIRPHRRESVTSPTQPNPSNLGSGSGLGLGLGLKLGLASGLGLRLGFSSRRPFFSDFCISNGTDMNERRLNSVLHVVGWMVKTKQNNAKNSTNNLCIFCR